MDVLVRILKAEANQAKLAFLADSPVQLKHVHVAHQAMWSLLIVSQSIPRRAAVEPWTAKMLRTPMSLISYWYKLTLTQSQAMT